MNTALKQYLRPDILLGAALVLAAFGISLFFGGYRDIEYAPAILALLVFACLGIIPAFWRGLALPVAPAAITVFVLWVYVTLSLSWSSVPFASLVTYLVFIACPLVFFTVLLSPDRERFAALLGALLLTGLAALAGWAVLQVAFFSATYGPRAHHPLPNPNNLAALLNLGLLPALALFLRGKQTGPLLWAALALTLLFVAGLVATGSRGGLLCGLLAGGLLIVLLRRDTPSFGKRLGLLLVPAILVGTLVGMLTGQHLFSRITGLISFASDPSAMARLAIWNSTWHLFRDHFWTGTGLGTFYLYYPAYRLPGLDNSTGHWAHMDPLQYGAEMGIAAPVIFYAMCIAVLVRTYKALKAAPQGSVEYTGIAALICALIALILHSHLTFNLYIMPTRIVAGLWLATWYILTARVLGSGFMAVAYPGWQKPFMAVVTVAIAGLISIMAVSSAAGQYQLLQARDQLKHGKIEEFVSGIGKAEQWAPRSFIDPEVQLAAFYIDLLNRNAQILFSTTELQSMFVQTKDLLDAAQQMNPPWAEIDYKRGQLYAAVNPDFEPDTQQKAIESFKTAIKKDPMHFQARQELAQLYIRRGLVEQAYDVLQQGLQYPHSAAVASSYNQIIDSIRNLVELKRAYEKQKEEKSQ